MQSDACDVAAAHLDLAGMQSGPELDADGSHRVPDCSGTTDGAGRAVEDSYEGVASGVHLTAAKPVQLLTNKQPMLVQQPCPAVVTQACRGLGGGDDVREEYGDQDPVGRRHRRGAGQESLDLRQNAVGVAGPIGVALTRKLDVPGPRNALSQIAAVLDPDDLVALPVQDQRGTLDRR